MRVVVSMGASHVYPTPSLPASECSFQSSLLRDQRQSSTSAAYMHIHYRDDGGYRGQDHDIALISYVTKA